MRFRIELVKLLAGLAIAVLSMISAGCLQAIAQAPPDGETTVGVPAVAEAPLIAQQDEEIQAFADSQYDYWDAKVLASFWGTDTWDAKARIGRKILWGVENVAYLEQMLLDARIEALNTADPIDYFFEGYTYDDAEQLRDFWGEISTWDTKLRIGRNLIMGNDDVVETALRLVW